MKTYPLIMIFICVFSTICACDESFCIRTEQEISIKYCKLDPMEMQLIFGTNSVIIKSLGFLLSCTAKGATEGITTIILEKFFNKSSKPNCHISNEINQNTSEKTIQNELSNANQLKMKPTIDDLMSFDRIFNPKHDPAYRSVLWGYLFGKIQVQTSD